MTINLKNSIDLLSVGLALLAIGASIVYKFISLSPLMVTLVLLIYCLIIAYFYSDIKKIFLEKNKHSIKFAKINLKPKKAKTTVFSVIYLSSILSGFIVLFANTSRKAIISPWELDTRLFFVSLIVASFCLLFLYRLNSRFSMVFSFLYALLINSVAVIIYKYGFGFDFFIHQATMELIDQKSLVEPKPFYYLGQYSLIIIAHKITQIPIQALHLILVPFLASSILVFKLYNASKYFSKVKFSRYASMLILLALPIGIFYYTTPQNLAWIFLILVILKSLEARRRFDYVYMYSLSLAAIITQPIAGIPALFLSLAISIQNSNLKKTKAALLRLLYLAAASALPIAFLLLNTTSHNQSTIVASDDTTSSFLSSLVSKFAIAVPRAENLVLNFIYFLESNLVLLAFFLVALALYLNYKDKAAKSILKLYLSLALAFVLSAFITSNLSFDFLIDYERLDYSMRIFFSGLLLLIPFLLSALAKIFDNLVKKENIFQIVFLLFLALMLPAFVYLDYPRKDNYHNSHSYSVSGSDVKAVRWIEENSQGEDYIVLANQQSSVAALQEFGFSRYYRQNIFYYPIPTGGPLYPYYLEIVNEGPKRQTMIEAMNLVRVNTAYLCISKYWWASPKLIDEARVIADEWHEVDNGEVVVFRFDR